MKTSVQNTFFISPETLTSNFDVALNRRNAGQGSVFYVWSFSCNDSISLAVSWLVGCFVFDGPLRQYFSLYRAVSQNEGERKEKR